MCFALSVLGSSRGRNGTGSFVFFESLETCILGLALHCRHPGSSFVSHVGDRGTFDELLQTAHHTFALDSVITVLGELKVLHDSCGYVLHEAHVSGAETFTRPLIRDGVDCVMISMVESVHYH